MKGNINAMDVSTDKIVIYEYWSDVPEDNVPDDVAAVLAEEYGNWQELNFEDSMFVYIVGESSWVTEESVHELRLEA